jgi:hypothetical protein
MVSVSHRTELSFSCVRISGPTGSPRAFARLAVLAAACSGGAAGCLSADAIPIRGPMESDAGDGSAEAEGDAAEVHCAEDPLHDPLVGDWAGDQGVCSFFSNGRYSDGCGLTAGRSGFAEDWTRLEGGNYFFSTSSLGSPAAAFSATASFNEDCSMVTLDTGTTVLALTRI